MPTLAPKPPDLDASGQPVGASGKPPDLDANGQPVVAPLNQAYVNGQPVSALNLARARAPMKAVLAQLEVEDRQKAAQAAPYLSAIGGAIGGAFGGVPGAAFGGVLGDAAKQEAQTYAGQPTQTPAQQTQEMGTAGVLQGGAEGVGGLLGKGMEAAGPWLMQKALKPTATVLKEYSTTAPQLVKTLLDEGVNVTAGGVEKLQHLLSATNDEIRAAVAGSPGTVSKQDVAARVLPTANRIAQQVNPTRDLQTVGDTVEEFVNHPVFTGPTLSVPEAQAMKVGTYQQIGKKYGEVSSAAIEAQKALARGLKEDIANEVPGLAGLNARDSELMAALDATGRRVAMAGNRDPIGFAWVAQHPATFLAALFDRSPAVKSMIARGLYQSAGAAAKVAPQLVRAAVVALTTHGATPDSGVSPAPE